MSLYEINKNTFISTCDSSKAVQICEMSKLDLECFQTTYNPFTCINFDFQMKKIIFFMLINRRAYSWHSTKLFPKSLCEMWKIGLVYFTKVCITSCVSYCMNANGGGTG